MDFFRNQRHARQQTLVFLALFVLIVTLVVVLTSVLVWLGCLLLSPENQFVYAGNTALVVVLIIIGACVVRSIELRGGGGAVVARHLGGEPLPASRLNNLDLQRFRNIAEEMAIASRTPMPALYWLPQEISINAFVAGFTPADAVLAVTRGALERLNRDELQGVVAHEFSHLLNGDMRLNTQVSSWLFGIYAVYTYGRGILKTSPITIDRKDPTFRPAVWPLVFIFGGALTVIGYIGKLSGRLLQAAISRQREYLADASAVQFTRQTMGLAGALKKIYFGSSLLQTSQGDAYNHFFLGEAMETSPLFATHPPLVERIRVLDASFNPDDDQRAALGANLDVDALHRALPLFFAAESSASASGRETAFTMRDGLALLFANLLDMDNEAVRLRQLESIEADWGNNIAYQTRILEPDVHVQKTYLRLTRLRLMLVQLHTLSIAQQQTLRRTLRVLIAADDNISLLEVVIAHLVDQYLHDMAHPGRVRVTGSLRLDECAAEIALLKDIVTNHTKEIPAKVALDSIDHNGKTATTNAHAVTQTLDGLNRLTLDEKKNLFQTLYDACGTPSQEQQEILSLLAACLHAPPLETMVRAVACSSGSDLTLEPISKSL
ncbi:MAG: M48 family metalloprotease [Burkholderiales bacterium]|jgi:Zn-dependent protease with chaperone function|nr:M48 family metalloprotease [Burkholderiales bacterium]